MFSYYYINKIKGDNAMSKRINRIDRVIKIEEKIEKAVKEGKSKEEIEMLIKSLNQIEYKLDNLDNFSY